QQTVQSAPSLLHCPSSTVIYPLSLHDALPIYPQEGSVRSLTRWQSAANASASGICETTATRSGRPPHACTVTSPLSIETSLTARSEEHTSELQSRENLVCRLLLEKKKPDGFPN